MALAAPSRSVDEALAGARDVLFGALPCEAVVRADRRVETVPPDEPLASAAPRMWWRRSGALLVVEDGRLAGILSEDDILHTLAEQLRAKREVVEAGGDEVVVWDALLGGLRVRDAMTSAADAAVVRSGASLLEGIEATFGPTSKGRRKSYIVVVDDDGARQRLVSFRDIARHLTQLYDDRLPMTLFPDAPAFHAAQRLAWRLLDLSLGWLRRHDGLGSPANELAADADGADTVARLADRARGYAIVHGHDGGPRGICTRRDLVRTLRSPFVRLEALRAPRLVTQPVKTVSEIDTLCGLFKLMAIEGFRHMPLVDEEDRVACVISIWQGIGLLSHPPGEGH
jgi:CBS domain-containing protein